MSLKTDLEKDLQEAFLDLDDLVQPLIYLDVINIFSALTNTTTQKETPYTCKGVKLTKAEKKIPDSSDIFVYFIILQKDLLVKPKESGKISFENKIYTIIEIIEDPASATWKLKCQE